MPVKRSLISIAFVAVLGSLVSIGEVQTLAPFSDFQALPPAELASLQVKLTYMGPLDFPIPTLAFTSTTGSIDLGAFTPFRRPGFESDYGLDQMGAITFTVAPALLQAMIDSVATLPGVRDGGVDSTGDVSFAMLKTTGGTKAFESIVNEANGRAFMTKIQEAFASDANAVRLARECACRMTLFTTNTPEDATARVAVKAGGFRRVRKTTTYVASVRVTNTSVSALAAPVTLLPHLRGTNVRLVGESGFTCAIGPGGEAYLDLPVGGGGLAPGAWVDVVVSVMNPSNARVRFFQKVFAGAGTR